MDMVRLDRWLFAVRIFKSRSLAARAVSGGKIKIDGQSVKPHRMIRIGEEIHIRKEGRTLMYRVTGLIEKRVGAPEALKQYELTEDPDVPLEVRNMLQLYRQIDKGRAQVRGKPSKKDRRLLRKLKDSD